MKVVQYAIQQLLQKHFDFMHILTTFLKIIVLSNFYELSSISGSISFLFVYIQRRQFISAKKLSIYNVDYNNRLTKNFLQAVIKRMQDPLKGVPIKTVKTIMYKIPSVFSGNCKINFLITCDSKVAYFRQQHQRHYFQFLGYYKCHKILETFVEEKDLKKIFCIMRATVLETCILLFFSFENIFTDAISSKMLIIDN